jgi:DNA-binding LytR/AlgR family response regulator
MVTGTLRVLIVDDRPLTSIDWRIMEKLTRSFATGLDSGKDNSRLLADRLDCLAPKMARIQVTNRRWFETSDKVSPQMGEVFVDDDGPPANNGVGEIARIAIKAKGRILFVSPFDVIVAKAEGNYVALVHKSGAYLVRETMATTEQKLAPFGFVRIHRSILVNTTLVRDLRRDNTGTYVLRTIDGSDHPVGRAYKRNLKMIARSWLGVEIV